MNGMREASITPANVAHNAPMTSVAAMTQPTRIP
jgi:hypothetical protein